MMDEKRYDRLVAEAFQKLLAAVDQIDPDQLEADATSDMVTLTSKDGQKCVVNTQRAAWQIWVAGLSRGIHFSYEDQTRCWKDDKEKGIELFAFISEVVESISGTKLPI